MDLWNMLEELESCSGSLLKKEALRRILKTQEGEDFMRYAFNDEVYNLSDKSLAKAFKVEKGKDVTLSIMEKCDGTGIDFIPFSLKDYSGDVKLAMVYRMLSEMHPTVAKWQARALLHDLRCGVQLKLVNTILEEIGKQKIFVFEVELCEKLEHEALEQQLKFPLIIETKYDGIRAMTSLKAGTVTIMSRHGNDVTHLFPELVKELSILKGDFVFDGEITSVDFQTLAKRVQRNEPSNDLPLTYNVFDILMYEGQDLTARPLGERKHFLKPALADMTNIIPAASYMVTTLKEVLDFYKEIVGNGGEGIIIKPIHVPYDAGGRKQWFKLKPVHSAEMKVIGATYGNGRKFEVISSLDLIDTSETVRCSVGSGIDDEWGRDLTALFKANKLLGKIAEIQYSELTPTKSIRFPRFIALRTDKTEADDLSDGHVDE